MPTENYSPNWHVRCLSVPGPDTDLTLHVAFDNARYMFGCGEGTQRAYVQKKLGLRGVEAIFLLDAQNRTRMGLPGVILTAADGGTSQLSVVGPPDTAHFISTFRSSVMRQDFQVIPKSMPLGKTPNDLTEVFRSSNVTVKAIALVPSALRTTPTPTPPQAYPIDIHNFRPDFNTTRPSSMSRPELEAWRNLVVAHMFEKEKGTIADNRRDQPKGPFIRNDGSFAASWPEVAYPLPLPTAEEQATEMVYILEPPPVRGKFNAQRAKELGVPSGPIRGRLVKGEDIEVDDPSVEGGKRIVRPADCLSGGGPGAVLIIVSCSPANLSSLLESTSFAPYQAAAAGTEEARKVHMMVHRVTSAVWKNTAYREWMASFGPDTQHFLADPHNYPNDVYFRSAAWKMKDLQTLNSEIFNGQHAPSFTRYEASDLPPNTTLMVANQQVRMYPPAKMEMIPPHDRDLPLEIEANTQNQRTGLTSYGPDVTAARTRALDAIQQQTDANQSSNGGAASRPGDEIVVTTLGTGSAIPSKYRNVSATLLTIPDLINGEEGAILLDCGEGTLGQMRRRYGPDAMIKLYRQLKMIFISHMHADHHLGLHSILEDRFRHGVTSPLYIIAPSSIGLHMQESASWQSPASDEALANVLFINSIRLKHTQRRQSGEKAPFVFSEDAPLKNKALFENGQEDIFNGVRRWPVDDIFGYSEHITKRAWNVTDNFMDALDLELLQVPLVQHRGHASGLVLKHRSGWKIVYSGDTKPCDNLIQTGSGATLLIHEATLEDDKSEMAFYKGHSTFSQAIEVGRKMKAKHILLNHFSQRYPKVPKLPLNIPTSPPSSPGSGSPSRNGKARPAPIISISFDLMSIKVSDMWKMAHYMEPISLLFPEEEDGDDAAVIKAVAENKNSTVTDDKAGPGSKANKEREGHGRTTKRRKSPDQRDRITQKKEKKSKDRAESIPGSDKESDSKSKKRPSKKQRMRDLEAKKQIEAPDATLSYSMATDDGREYSEPEATKGEDVVMDLGEDEGPTDQNPIKMGAGGEKINLKHGPWKKTGVSEEFRPIDKLAETGVVAEVNDPVVGVSAAPESVEVGDVESAETGLTPALEDVDMSDGTRNK